MKFCWKHLHWFTGECCEYCAGYAERPERLPDIKDEKKDVA